MKVEDVMSRDVLTVSPETPLKKVAELLVRRDISGLPVVDAGGRVLGVVSESDILYKERGPEPRAGLLARLFRRDTGVDSKLAARTAADAMTSPPLTAHPTMAVAEAATRMLECGVDRLVVVKGWSFGTDGADQDVVGIVTRGDCVRAFVRSDDEIGREIHDILEHQYGLIPHRVHVTVDGGEVVLDGEVDLRTDAEGVANDVARVPGVVTVTNNLSWRRDAAGSEHYDAYLSY